MACFICFVHKGILPCNNTGAACPEPPGKTSMISPPTLKLYGACGGTSGPVSSEVMPTGCYCADYWSGRVLTQMDPLCQSSLSWLEREPENWWRKQACCTLTSSSLYTVLIGECEDRWAFWKDPSSIRSGQNNTVYVSKITYLVCEEFNHRTASLQKGVQKIQNNS